MHHVAADRDHEPSSRPLLRRMVSASKSAWVGCSWAPSPALITEPSTCAPKVPPRRTRGAAPPGYRVHRVQRHRGVDQSVSPLRIEDWDTDMFHDVGAEAFSRQFERGLGPGRGLEEQIDLNRQVDKKRASCAADPGQSVLRGLDPDPVLVRTGGKTPRRRRHEHVVSQSSIRKGETLIDTAVTLNAMQPRYPGGCGTTRPARWNFWRARLTVP